MRVKILDESLRRFDEGDDDDDDDDMGGVRYDSFFFKYYNIISGFGLLVGAPTQKHPINGSTGQRGTQQQANE